MLRFRGFKASLNFLSGKQTGTDQFDTSPGVSITGAYRTNKDELYESFKYPDPPKQTHQTISPSMVRLPSSRAKPSAQVVKPSKSTGDLNNSQTQQSNLRNSTPNVSQSNNSNQPTKAQQKEQKKLEKTRLAEQKKREKLAAKEQQKEEKLRKEREKQSQQKRAQEIKKNTPKTQKRAAPQPKPVPQANPVSQVPAPRPVQYSTNTLESSISKSSGPPPYEVVPNKNDTTGNTSFAKLEKDTGSWDLISQHRKQINRPAVSKSVPKQTHLDLNYNVQISKVDDNSEA